MTNREDNSSNSLSRPSFPSPGSDEGRKRLNVHFPEVIITIIWPSNILRGDYHKLEIILIKVYDQYLFPVVIINIRALVWSSLQILRFLWIVYRMTIFSKAVDGGLFDDQI